LVDSCRNDAVAQRVARVRLRFLNAGLTQTSAKDVGYRFWRESVRTNVTPAVDTTKKAPTVQPDFRHGADKL
jgi:hypothetical protein